MKAAFRVKASFQAEVAMDRDKKRIITDAVAKVEKLDLKSTDYAIFDVDGLGLKIVIELQKRLIHVMTKAEAQESGLPGSPQS